MADVKKSMVTPEERAAQIERLATVISVGSEIPTEQAREQATLLVDVGLEDLGVSLPEEEFDAFRDALQCALTPERMTAFEQSFRTGMAAAEELMRQTEGAAGETLGPWTCNR